MADILNSSRTGLRIFSNGVEINETLDKWKNAKKGTSPKGNSYILPQTMVTSTGNETRVFNDGTVINVISNNGPWGNVIEESGQFIDNPTPQTANKDLDSIASMELLELNRYIQEQGLTYLLSKTTGQYDGNFSTPTPFIAEVSYDSESTPKLSFFQKVKLLFAKKEKPEMDVISFFANVKSTSKKSFDGYVNRVEKYLHAIHNAKIINQTALIEKLTRELITNRYEFFLASEGYYHVITEEQIVDFVKRSERGVSLDYMKNFIRPIPQEVVEKIAEADKLQVFDNYVILHYDPKGKARQDTAKEEIKRRDPIVFGVIAGSTKLYYITDWIDEYCDLTLEKFVDTLKITKDDLVIDEERKAEIKAAKENSKKENGKDNDTKKTTKTTKKKATTKKTETTKKSKK